MVAITAIITDIKIIFFLYTILYSLYNYIIVLKPNVLDILEQKLEVSTK